MIIVSNAIQGINFNLDTEGVETLIGALKNTLENQLFEIENIAFSDKKGHSTFRKLSLKIADDNTIQLKEKEIHLSLEIEDIEYSIELFKKTTIKGFFDSPEWLQVTNYSSKKGYYIYVFLIDNQHS
jgi:hypothetical protein